MIEIYWQKGISFETYLNNITQKIEFPEPQNVNKEEINKFKLSLERAKKITENYLLKDENYKNLLEKKNLGGKFLLLQKIGVETVVSQSL